MALLKDLKKANKPYRCENCKEMFGSSKIKLQKVSDNCEILTPLNRFIYVDKKGVITSGSKMPSGKKGDRFPCCPKCGYTHMYGFDPV